MIIMFLPQGNRRRLPQDISSVLYNRLDRPATFPWLNCDSTEDYLTKTIKPTLTSSTEDTEKYIQLLDECKKQYAVNPNILDGLCPWKEEYILTYQYPLNMEQELLNRTKDMTAELQDGYLAFPQSEKEQILEALKQARGNKTVAAKLLQIDRKTLYNKMHLYGLLTLIRMEQVQILKLLI